MKRFTLFSLVILISLISKAQLSKSVVSTAGGLSAVIGVDINTVTNLTVSGNINAKDFVTLFNMPVLSVLDLSAVTIDAYIGTDGPMGAGKGGGALQYSPNTIPTNTFYENRVSKTTLTLIILPNSLTTIGDYAFFGCTGLSTVTFSNSITTIGTYAFANCTSLGSVALPNLLTSLQYSVFSNCSNLSTVSIPATVTTIDVTAFQGCNGLNSFTVDAANPNFSSLGGVLFDKSKTTLFQYPALKTGVYTIPATVTTISDGAFKNCINLSSVNIPATVSTIKSSAFSGCTSLTSIYAYALTPINIASQTNVFFNVSKSTCTLYVPIGSLAAYSAAFQWKDFTNIVESNTIPCITVTPTAMNVAAGPSSPTFDISSNVSWTASSNDSWITLSSYAGSNGATITMTIESNPTLAARSTSVVIFGAGMPTKYINVNQASGVPSLSVSVDSVKVIAGQYSSGQFTINSTQSWTVSSNQSWLTLNIESGSGNSTINVNATENLLTQSREATVTVSAVGLPSKTVIVTQAAWKPLLSLSKNLMTLTDVLSINSEYFDITSNTNWSISSNQSWLKVSNTSGSNNKKIIIQASLNNLKASRTATITVSVANLAPQVITVTQPGKSAFLSIVSNQVYLSSAENLKYDVILNSTTTWSVQSDQPWLSMNKTSGYDDGIITIEASVNTSGISRSAILTFSGAGVVTKYLTVKQASSTLVFKATNISAGGLSAALTDTEANTITDLTVTGTIDDRDFGFMRDSLPELQHLNLSASSFVSRIDNSIVYSTINEIPWNIYYKRWTNYLSTFVLPNNLTAIGQNAFYQCNTLKTIQLPSTLKTIDASAFYQCFNLSSALFPANLVFLGESAFRECKSLNSITIPSTADNIGDYVFWGCLALRDFTNNSLPSINNKSLTLYGNMPGRFYNTSDVVFSNVPTFVEWETFMNCVNLNSIYLPAQVDSTNHFAFYNCSASITVDPSNPKLSSQNGVLYNKNKTEIIFCPITKTGSFTIPSTVKNIRENAFVNCAGITSVNIPPLVTDIGPSAFIGCSGLTSITIPASVTTIDYDAFKGCSGLTSIYANAITPIALDSAPNYKKYFLGGGYFSEGVFRNVNKSTCTLYVPAGSVDAYKSSPQWLDFLNIVADVPTNIAIKPSVTIHANSANNSFVINGLKDNAMLTLVDLNGKVLQSKQVSENENVSMKSYPKGMYIVKIKTSEEIFTQKIINN